MHHPETPIACAPSPPHTLHTPGPARMRLLPSREAAADQEVPVRVFRTQLEAAKRLP
jgi:hypothetical protein